MEAADRLHGGETGRTLFLDCVGGVAGDMLLAALIDAGQCPELPDELPRRLGFADVSVTLSASRPGGFAAHLIEVDFDPGAHPQHRDLGDVLALLDRADLPAAVRDRAARVFRRLAEAEGAVHGAPADQVHFHEVGAVDAICDVVGCCLALEEIGAASIVCSPLPMGHGTVECAHGVLPLPAPAVAAMLPGVPVYDAGVHGETVTPTGAALVVVLSDRFDGMPAMTVERVGLGAGSRQDPGRPNLVRAFVGRPFDLAGPATPTTGEHDNVMVECTLDDIDPRLLPVVISRLLGSGALDAFVTPVVMKKGRPGFLLSALTTADQLASTVQLLLHETTTLGCRSYPVMKHRLARRMAQVDTPWGEVAVKLALAGEQVLRAIPEYDDCAELAARAGVPVAEVLAAATSAARCLCTGADPQYPAAQPSLRDSVAPK